MIRIEEFRIGFRYIVIKDIKNPFNSESIWEEQVYGFNSPSLLKISKMIDAGLIKESRNNTIEYLDMDLFKSFKDESTWLIERYVNSSNRYIEAETKILSLLNMNRFRRFFYDNNILRFLNVQSVKYKR